MKNQLREIRIKAGLTQAQLANFFGLSSQTRISEYENGVRNPSAGIKKLYQLIKEKKIKPAQVSWQTQTPQGMKQS